MAITNASRLADFGSGIGTDGSVLELDNAQQRVGIGTTNPQSTLQVGTAVSVYGNSGIVSAISFYGDGANLTGLANTDVINTENINVIGVATVGSAVTINSTGIDAVSGVITASSFVGNVTGNCSGSSGSATGNAGGLTGTPDITVRNITGVAATFTGVLTYEDVTNVDSVGIVTARGGLEVGAAGVGATITSTGNAIISGFSTFKNDVTFVGAGANITFDQSTDDLIFNDNAKAIFGTSSDGMELFHDGSHSIIDDVGTGSLVLRSDTSLKLLKRTGDESMLIATPDGSVDLYYNASKKFETTIEGTITTGIATVTAIDGGISAWVLGANGTNHYTFTGPGNLSAADDPQIELQRGQTYVFRNRSGGHPFRIQSTVNGSTGTQYSTGVTNNDGGDGTDIIFDVPFDAPNILYYQCTSHANMGGVMLIGERGIPANVQSGAYVLVADDAGKTIYISTGGVTINNSIFEAGDAVTIINNSASTQTITQGSGVTLYDTGDDGSTGSKTLKARGMCTVWFASASVGYISGNFD